VAQDERKQCYMRFPLGKLAGWNPRWSLNLSRMSDVELAESIRRAVSEKLFPVVRNVVNINQLMSLRMSDEEPVRWIHVNGAMRMAQIAFLASKLDAGVIEIRAMLQRRANEIRAHLRGGTLEPASYIDHIVEDAKCAVLATKDP